MTTHGSAALACARCGRPITAGFCGQCGAPATAVAPTSAPVDPRHRHLVPMLGGVAVIAVIALVGVRTAAPESGKATAVPASSSPIPTSPSSATVAATATCARAGSTDSLGRVTTYEPSRAIDGAVDTAWRCDGDGTGQQLALTFSTPISLSRIGIVPGLAKTDPGDGTDRYAQNRRLSLVRVTLDDGEWVDLVPDTSPLNRTTQHVSFDGTRVTRTVTMTILGNVPGMAQNGHAAYETVAISHVTWE